MTENVDTLDQAIDYLIAWYQRRQQSDRPVEEKLAPELFKLAFMLFVYLDWDIPDWGGKEEILERFYLSANSQLPNAFEHSLLMVVGEKIDQWKLTKNDLGWTYTSEDGQSGQFDDLFSLLKFLNLA